MKQGKTRNKIEEHHIAAFDEFVNEFRKESDRAAVILGTAKIDYLLLQLLLRFVVPSANKDDDLLEGDSPLSTLSARINISYRLGLIDAGFARALHLARKIRNSFAHEVSSARLDVTPHRERIRELIAPFVSTDLFKDVKRSFFPDKTGSTADYLTILAIIIVRLETITLKVLPLKSDNSFSLVPLNYRSKTRSGTNS